MVCEYFFLFTFKAVPGLRQKGPPNPGTQKQVKPPSGPGTQVPPNRHGLLVMQMLTVVTLIEVTCDGGSVFNTGE